MAFQSREEYEAWKRRATGQATASSGTAPADSRFQATAKPAATPAVTAVASPDDIELRLSALYGAIVVFAGVAFAVIGFVPFGKAGPTFHTICRIAGPLAILAGIVLLRSRKVFIRMTASGLQLHQTVIPWTDIQGFQRMRSRRNYWIGINLKTPQTDLDKIALKARAVPRAMGDPGADFDYVILETDLPRSGLWFIDECQRRMAAAAGGGRS